ncbi:MAG: low molecular weight protein-tyrosine-phosphatase [Candidatus Pristimantibacillus sp.]
MKAKVLFVCLGNICRSPMAEAVFRNMVIQKGLESTIEVDSAGTGDWHIGHPPHEGTRKQLDLQGISYAGMKARQFIKQDNLAFDYIVCMDSKNKRDVQEIIGHPEEDSAGSQPVVITFMDLLPAKGIADVPDPYYSGNFDYVYELVHEGCEVLLDRVINDQKE